MTAGTEAKRAARAHFMFNMVGVLWMIPLFGVFAGFIDKITPGDANDPVYTLYHLALFHSMFNLTNICIQVPFVKQLAQLATKMVREKEGAPEEANTSLTKRPICRKRVRSISPKQSVRSRAWPNSLK